MTPPDADRWPDEAARDAAAALPPVRDDEPASLRRDILDELADHLGCAFRRELLRTHGDSKAAETNVRDRFGDPRRVVRRLWLDAMKGKLMAHKFVIGTCAAVIVVCVLFGVLLWRAVGDLREANAAMLRQAQESNAALIEQSRQANAAMFEQLRKLGESPAVNDPEWNPVTIRLVAGASGGPSAAGIVATLDPEGEESEISETAGPEGLVDFGLRRPGKYSLAVRASWGEVNQRSFHVRPGRPVEFEVVCPPGPPGTVPVDWDVRWPEAVSGLEPQGSIWCVAYVTGVSRRQFGNDAWSVSGGDLLLAFHPDGRVVDLTEADLSVADVDLVKRSSILRNWQQFERRTYAPAAGYAWAGGTYRLHELGLSHWDGGGSPLSLLARDSDSPTVLYGDSIPDGYVGGQLGNALELGEPDPQWTAPADGSASWPITVPQGLASWAHLREGRRAAAKDGGSSDFLMPPDPQQVYPMFREGNTSDPAEARLPAT